VTTLTRSLGSPLPLAADLAWLTVLLTARERTAAEPPPESSPLAELADRFRLSSFERNLLLLAAAPDLDADIARAIAEAEPRRPWPHFGLALRLFDGADIAALAPTGALRRFGLLGFASEGALSTRALVADERVVFALRGDDTIDAGLRDWLSSVEDAPGSDRFAPNDPLTHEIARLLADDTDPLILIVGASAAQRLALVAAAARLLGACGLRLGGAQLLQPELDPTDFSRRWQREASLAPRILTIEASEVPPRWTTALERLSSCVLASPTPPVLQLPRPQAIIRLRADDLSVRYGRWRARFPTLPEDAALRLAVEYRHAPERLHAGPAEDEGTLAAACRTLTHAGMAGLADRVDTCAAWDDLVLPMEATAQLHDIALHAATRTFVNEAWGFGARSGRSAGMAALFTGPSGTGKTLAARVIAAEIGRDLYRVDLSRIVSKYVGETEKNLACVFDAAEQGGVVLLFDEADALFGKRSEVKDSHDRYANLEVAYLLQRMECFTGLAILTTNLDQVLDAAFIRRLAFVVRFPFPTEAARRDIWSRAFPAATPTAALDPARLARIPLAGGHIASIAWSAACRAAYGDGTVAEAHVLAAARAECAKLERPWQDTWILGDPR